MPQRSEVWYAIPSANPQLCRETLPAWRDMGYQVAVLQNQEAGKVPADYTEWSDVYPGWAASVNHLAARLVQRGASIVVTGGDDMLPDPTARAEEIAGSFHERFENGFGVMQPAGDTAMNSAEYCGSPWLGAEWIKRAYRGTGPMWPEYRHNWADHEIKCVADRLGALWMRPDLTQEHRHFSVTGDEPPVYWNEIVAPHDRDDVELFIARRLLGFPEHEPLGDAPIPRREWDREPGPAERYWLARYASNTLQTENELAMQRALTECADLGANSVLIYGAGSLTRSCGLALRSPPVTIAGIVDDDAREQGGTLWGFKVSDPDEAPEADAVLLAARSPSDAMHKRAANLADMVCTLQASCVEEHLGG